MSDQKVCPTCGTEYPLSERFCPRDGTALRSADPQADLMGSIVADRYHILKKLGEGGMGTVYLAEHVKMGRKSALKVMNPGMNTDADAIARFNREASNASRLSHPNICGIYDFGETPEGLIYLAMEFVEGSSLTSLIEKGGSLPAPRAASIVHQTADALQVAHDAGIVHRDLKPDNIMVARNRDGSDLVKVVDFGIAKASSSDAQKVTKTGLVVGTPEYMSPEQLAGDKLDGRSDIYSLGLVAFNCLTGLLPFPANTAQEAMIMRLTDRPRTLAEMVPEKSWPEGLQATMDKALARDAAERYQSAAQFGREFAAAVADMPMTQAMEAGTMVVNAAAAGAGAKNVPATRVAASRPSAKTEAMEAPAGARRPAASKAAAVEPVKKSAMPMVLGGVGGLAVMGFTAFKLGFLGGPAAAPTLPDTTPKTPDSSQVSKQTTPAGTETTKTPDPVPTGGNRRPDPVPTGGNTSKVPGNTTTGGTPNTTPAGTSATASATIASWRQKIDNAPAGEEARIGRNALREIEPLIPTLSGITRDDAYYVALMAYGAMDNDEGVCKYAGLVQRSSLDSEHKQTATTLLQGRNCGP